jgi:hypothetical protein
MRPLGVGEILDASFSAFRRNFGQLILAVLVIVVPTAIVQTLVIVSISDIDYDFGSASFGESSETYSGSEAAGILVLYVLLILNQILAPAACLRLIGGDILGLKVTAKESVGFAFARLPRLMWVLLLYFLSLVVGLFLCLIGIVWTYVLFALAVPAALYEGARGADAMRRSADLIKDNWWRSFGVIAIMGVIVAVVQQVLALAVVGGVLVNSDNDVLNAILFTLVNVVGLMIALPLQAAATAYLYFDLRVRKEGFDLQLLAERMSSEPPPRPYVEGLPPVDSPPSGGGFLPPTPPGG